ncbi:MAG: undecaprenyl-phosphate galactose phosphotransferase WbaP [Pirellulales bacterium]|nr:undecaprenyl-phosphate galactose phosphotransferase WbaP [Pirellulales bacterium]
MKDESVAPKSGSSTAILTKSWVGQGVFQSRLCFPQLEGDADESGNQPAAGVGLNAFSRKVGLRYSMQVLRGSLPLLATDVIALTATIVGFRYAFLYLNVELLAGINLSACLMPIVMGFVLLNMELGLYLGVRLSPVEELRRLVVSVTFVFLMWAVVEALLQGTIGIQRWYLSVVYLSCVLVLPISRSWVRHMLGRYTSWGIPTIVCGDDAAAVRVYQWLADNRHLGLRPVGVVGDPERLLSTDEDFWYLGSWEEMVSIADERRVFWAVVVPPEDRSASVSSLVADYLYTIPQVHVLSELTGLPDPWNPQRLDGLAGIHLQQNLMLPGPRLTKRCLDLVVTLIGGIFLLPLFFCLALIVKLSSRGPAFYGHKRIGRYGVPFKAWKFRTMFENSNVVLEKYLEDNPELKEEWQRDHKLRFDPRVTRIGRFMRKTSLDELPQLWNVIRGDMSLVGPRPIVTDEIVKYGPHYGLYTMVKPGITGLWQVSGRNNTTYEERVQLDAYYVRNWSPWGDVFLLIKTIRIVVFARGAY